MYAAGESGRRIVIATCGGGSAHRRAGGRHQNAAAAGPGAGPESPDQYFLVVVHEGSPLEESLRLLRCPDRITSKHTLISNFARCKRRPIAKQNFKEPQALHMPTKHH